MRGRTFGARARDEIQFRDPLAFLGCRDQQGAAVEMVYDLEDLLFDLFRRGPRRQKTANSVMRSGARALWYQRIRRFLDSIMQEPVGALQREDEAGPDRFPHI